MLIPRQRIISDTSNACVIKYCVYDTDNCAFVENKIFGTYNTFEECENAITFSEGFKLVS